MSEPQIPTPSTDPESAPEPRKLTLPGQRAAPEYPEFVQVVTQPAPIGSTTSGRQAISAVVTILNLHPGNVAEVEVRPFPGFSSGTGFFFDSSGLLLTNNHVV